MRNITFSALIAVTLAGCTGSIVDTAKWPDKTPKAGLYYALPRGYLTLNITCNIRRTDCYAAAATVGGRLSRALEQRVPVTRSCGKKPPKRRFTAHGPARPDRE